MIRFFEMVAPLSAIGGGIMIWNAEGRWWLLVLGILLMAWGMAWLQSRGR
jgi:hypothetical protein